MREESKWKSRSRLKGGEELERRVRPEGTRPTILSYTLPNSSKIKCKDSSLEDGTIGTERLYYGGLDSGRVNKSTVAGYPNDTYTNPNNYIQQLSSASGARTPINSRVISGAGGNLNEEMERDIEMGKTYLFSVERDIVIASPPQKNIDVV